MNESRVHSVEAIMREFVARTGISNVGDAARRYLWTDAFAVFALLGLYRYTRDRQYLDWTLRLVAQVHHVLGRYRPDDTRSGWLSGLSEREGEERPTAGGLRIGKPLPERRADQPFDEQLEWERDGQYFHYLTKWMHALNRVSVQTGDARFNTQAVDLAKAAHRAFVYDARPGGAKRMYWKMSSDLKRPLIRSMGQLDPLDGFMTFSRLQQTQREFGIESRDLGIAIAGMRRMCEDAPGWATTDPLGVGGLLTELTGILQLVACGELHFDERIAALIRQLLADLQASLELLVPSSHLTGPASTRLPFRELGLALGLRSIDFMRIALNQSPALFGGAKYAATLLARIELLNVYSPISDQIENFWLARETQHSDTWTEHLDINTAMLATTLVPEACFAELSRSNVLPRR